VGAEPCTCGTCESRALYMWEQNPVHVGHVEAEPCTCGTCESRTLYMWDMWKQNPQNPVCVGSKTFEQDQSSVRNINTAKQNTLSIVYNVVIFFTCRGFVFAFLHAWCSPLRTHIQYVVRYSGEWASNLSTMACTLVIHQ
jgi:hypothetical protein